MYIMCISYAMLSSFLLTSLQKCIQFLESSLNLTLQRVDFRKYLAWMGIDFLRIDALLVLVDLQVVAVVYYLGFGYKEALFRAGAAFFVRKIFEPRHDVRNVAVFQWCGRTAGVIPPPTRFYPSPLSKPGKIFVKRF